ncbi:MAG: hypothetical protein ACRBN8_01515 [Nannocystales bacterium]
MLALALALASMATDVTWTDRSGQCPASRGQAPVDLAAQDFEDASVEIEVDATDEGLAATLRLETPDGVQTRTLQSPACDTLVEAAVLITRAAATSAVVPEPPSIPEPEPESEPEPELELDEEPEPEPVEPRAPANDSIETPPPESPTRVARTATGARSLFASVGAFGFGTFGTTPGFGGGGGVALGLGSKVWRADVSALVAAPTTTSASDTGAGIQAWGWAVGAHGCGTFDVLQGRLQPGVCGGLEAGEQLGEGTGTLVQTQPQRGAWVAATLGPTLRVFVAPGLALVLDVNAVISVRRPGFLVPDGPSHEPEIVAPRAALGFELHLPRR